MVQFRPGRIDHHNAQILCAVAGLHLLARAVEEPRAAGSPASSSPRSRRGYEGIALVVPILALACAVYPVAPDVGRGPIHAAVAASATLLVLRDACHDRAVASSVTSPATRCHSISSCLRAQAHGAVGGLGAVPCRHDGRLAVAATGSGLGVMIYGALETRLPCRPLSVKSMPRSNRSGSITCSKRSLCSS